MTTRLILLAHGETSATRRAAFADDEGLDERGRVVALERRTTLRGCDDVLTSPALAARQTAAIFDANAVVDDHLRDVDVGLWRGRALADVGDPAAAWIADPGFDGHGGESIERLVTRMARWLPARRARRGTTLAVTHAAVLRATLVALLDAPPSAFWLIDAPPLSALTLTSDGRRWAVRGLT